MEGRRKLAKSTPYKFPKKASEFTQINELHGDQFSHRIFKVKKKPGMSLDDIPESMIPMRYKNFWYLKETKDQEESITEVIAQEFFRFFIPGHPKARLVLGEKNKFLVITKEVPGFHLLDERNAIEIAKIRQKLMNGNYFGLGHVLIAALFLNETDLKLDNLGVNCNGQVVKIDSGCCFANLVPSFGDRRYPITASDIHTLPFVENYEAHNWLDYRSHYPSTKKQEVNTASKLFGPNFSMWPRFRNEVNQTILRIIAMPPALIELFVDMCVPESVQQMSMSNGLSYLETVEACQCELVERQEALRDAALHDIHFKEYIKSDEAVSDLTSFVQYIRTFKTIGSRVLPISQFEAGIANALTMLRQNLVSMASSQEQQMGDTVSKSTEIEMEVSSSDQESQEDDQAPSSWCYRGFF